MRERRLPPVHVVGDANKTLDRAERRACPGQRKSLLDSTQKNLRGPNKTRPVEDLGLRGWGVRGLGCRRWGSSAIIKIIRAENDSDSCEDISESTRRRPRCKPKPGKMNVMTRKRTQ